MKKGITIVLVANIINMIFSVIISFLLPKYLSIDTYGYYKVFQLYINYFGIAHLGFVDGIYLKYGGRSIKSLDKDEILTNISTVRNMQLVLSVIMIIISIAINNNIAVMLSLLLVPINMVSFYKSLFQATGEFKDYGIILSILPVIMCFCNLILIFVVKSDNYIHYTMVVVLSNLILYLLLEYKSKKMFGKIKVFAFDFLNFVNNIKNGITLMIGNFASILITSIARWLIQLWMPISEFSYYSFAVSVENMVSIFVSAVTTTLYNYLCKMTDVSKIRKLKNCCMFIGVYLISLAFPIKFIIQIWLNKYENSISSLFLLICAHIFYFVIKAIYINLYKARGKQKHYFYQMLFILGLAFCMNVFAYRYVSKTIEAFAAASLGVAIIWYCICYFEFKDIQEKWYEPLILIISGLIYIFCGLVIENSIVGFVIYITCVTFVMFIAFKVHFIEFIKQAIKYVNSSLKKIMNI